MDTDSGDEDYVPSDEGDTSNDSGDDGAGAAMEESDVADRTRTSSYPGSSSGSSKTGTTSVIQHNFCVRGHPKCFNDACFDLIKRYIKARAIWSSRELLNAVHESSRLNTGLAGDTVTYYDWKAFLAQFFASTSFGIRALHHFRYERARTSTARAHAASSRSLP